MKLSKTWPEILVIILALPFRVLFLKLTEFKADEALSFWQTWQFWQKPYLITAGLISSTGVRNLPLFNYLLLILGFLSPTPLFLTFAIGLVNSFLVLVFYLILKKYYSQVTSLAASLLLATSPWAILFSRKIWAQDLVLLLVIPIIYLLHQSKKSFWLAFCLVLLCQLHASGIFFSVITIAVLIFYKTKLDFNKIFWGILTGLVFSLPYIYLQISSQTFCPDCQTFISFLKTPKSFDWNNFLRPGQLLTGSFFEFVLGNKIGWEKFFYWQYPVLISGIWLIIFKYKKCRFLLFYILGLPLLYFLTKTPAYPHYYAGLLPFLALTDGLVFDYFYNRKNKLLKIAVIFLLGLILAGNLIFMIKFFRFLKLNDVTGDYGRPFYKTEEFVNKNLQNYQLLPYYEELKYYAFIFSQDEVMHPKLAEYFLEKQNVNLSIEEFQKSDQTPEILFNLGYLYFISNNSQQAENYLQQLKVLDTGLSFKLEELIKK